MMPIRSILPAPTSRHHRLRWPMAALFLLLVSSTFLRAQDWVHLTAGNDNTSIRLAAANFKPLSNTGDLQAYKHTFDTVLYSDLSNAGIFDMVSKSLAPQSTPGFPAEMNIAQWAQAPSSAAMVAFGNINLQGNNLVANGFLDDAHNTQYPQIFSKQYNGVANDQTARDLAHQFADDIIFRLSGGTPGIAESKIVYSKRSGPGVKEIWMMDYDGANQHAITHLGEDSISPRISPDNSLVAFSALGRDGWEIRMFSLLLGRLVHFSNVGGTNVSPAWAPSGQQIAFSSSRSGDPEIWVSDPQGSLARKVTSYRGPDVSPTWNPKSGAQIAWVSGRTGLPQLYIMDSDGSGVTRMTDGGYATSPSWSPNGQFLTFAWDRHYGPGAPGGQDIYVMEVATKKWIQLTHDIGRCDFPSWSPDGRHIVFANSPDGLDSHTRIMTMLADGTQKRALTGSGSDMPNWSWK
ncbi:MAG: translocation protein TolB [Acidobacteriaceae bacterium]